MNARKIITTVARVLVGLLFIFSGLIKANDPLGFSYKLDEYFDVFGLPFLKSISLLLSMSICVLEVFLGVALLVGAFVNFTVLLLLLTMVFFTFLTFYSAYYNKVTDCGCFGDAIKLTPWQSFWKDIVLMALIIILLVNKKYITPIFNSITRRGLAVAGAVLTLLFTFFAWYILPPIDFRAYKPGNDICEQMKVPEGELASDVVEMVFIYEKPGGEKVELTMEQLGSIDESWTFVDRKDKVLQKAYQPKINNFAIEDRNGANITKPFLDQKGYRLVIVQYDLQKTNKKAQQKLNALITEMQQHNPGVKVWALTCASVALADEYQHVHHVPYQFHHADCIPLKTMIRSNPGLILMHDCAIEKYWSSNNLPSRESILENIKRTASE